MTKFFIIAALFCLAVPAALAAPPAGQGPSGGSTPNPAQLCAEQLKTMGAVGFQSTYAPNGNAQSAMGKCISRQARASAGDQNNAAKKCKSERVSLGVTGFNDKYGTNKNKRNAFGKCVSGLAKEQGEDRQENTLNAAKTCKAERASMGVMNFNELHGTNKNKKNAFGKCVSKLAKAQGSSS
ncbi:MAG: hypothetical protein OEW52_00925 [Thermoleophilia bacterium]|nr:hypothetical protein [Thermoleophilia bacterium]MDH4339862.1 hypothetical protein [Thermoleophilia bacterium]MDH5279691.1 hypothetical protein [Thermoleophilia bacterium]